MKKKMFLEIKRQPDDTSCGPTCLQAVYRFYGDHVPLAQLIKEVYQFQTGGTVAVMLGIHALKRGYKAVLHSYNLNLFDPTWFNLSSLDILKRLKRQSEVKYQGEKYRLVNEAYIKFLELGGELKFEDLNASLLGRYLGQDIPLLTGLSATWLYQSSRENPKTNIEDDIAGLPVGHFVVLHGLNQEAGEAYIADPERSNPLSDEQYYKVKIDRLLAAIFLGVITYDANILMITPKKVKAVDGEEKYE
jgi:hypothetical protein